MKILSRLLQVSYLSQLCVFLQLTWRSYLDFYLAELNSPLKLKFRDWNGILWLVFHNRTSSPISRQSIGSSISFSNLALFPVSNCNITDICYITDTGTFRMQLIGRWITMSNKYKNIKFCFITITKDLAHYRICLRKRSNYYSFQKSLWPISHLNIRLDS